MLSQLPPSRSLLFSCRFARQAVLTTLWVALAGFSVSRDLQAAPPETEPDREGLALFQNEIRPLLAHRCLKCHGGETSESEFSLISRQELIKGGTSGTAIVPGKSRESRLFKRITHATQPGMPFQSAKLSETEINQIARWIDLGAPYDAPLADKSAPVDDPTRKQIAAEAREFWSFRPLSRPAPPEVRHADWCRNPIDRFIVHRLESEGLTPNPRAAGHHLLRRAHLALTGLPPTPGAVADSEAGFSSAQLTSTVDALLNSPHYGERWARHWLDIARFGESHGFEHDYDRPTAYTYRDFVIEAFNRDLPFNQFVQWQLAGDELAPQDNLAMMATGYLAAGVHSTQITKNEVEKHRYDELDDIVNTVGLSMLGLSVGCARCHDHKYDAIPQRDYYRMVAAFTTTVRSEMDLEIDRAGTEVARAEHARAQQPLVAALRQYEADQLPTRFAAWEEQNPLRTEEFPWLVMEPNESKSEGGATLVPQPDGAILATGANPQFDGYTFVIKTSLVNLRHLRIEALSHPSLVRGGPGRADNGNFDLTDLKVTIAPADDPTRTQPVNLVDPRATFEQSGLPIAAAIDGDERSGWAVDPQFGKDHAAGFRFAEPVGFPQGSVLTLRLKFRGNDRHNFGRTRLALSTAGDPPELTAAGLSANILTARTLPANQRTPEQQQQLLAWFGSRHDAEWQKRNQAVLEHAAREPKPRMQKALISSEGVPALRLHTQGGDFLEQTHFLRRGDPNQKVAVVTTGFLQVLTPADENLERWLKPAPEGAKTSHQRAALAAWITDTEQGAGPLLARVIVNRLWQHHFGRGLVATPNDFGVRGTAPSHPELLDWLAGQLIEHNWHLKPIHKLILDSATWQQSSQSDPQKLAVDRDNRLLWRHSPQRLEAEVIRDSLLSVSGLLDPTPFGPGTLDEASRRRSIYFTVKRSRLIPSLQAFDAPDALTSVGERPATTVAPQALLLMNNPQSRGAAMAMAERLLAAHPDQLQAVLTEAWRSTVSRSPTAAELGEGTAFFQSQAETYATPATPEARRQALADYCQVLFCLNEFVYLE
ncbi:MAG: PSD1 and planctomycete cytochrome C domain-containing protein [Planctomycetaceae bacterium]